MTSNTEKSLQILKEEIQRLEEQGISGHILEELMEFRRENDTGDAAEERCIRPQIPFFGKEVLEMAIAALLAGENVLLCGGKATGKNILAENLAWLFRRPTYNISFHVNTDSSTLIGTDTFRNNEVQLREGPIIQCAKTGGFGILDEINMAKNDAVSVLHATLDYRRAIDVPGYERVVLHPATRFIGTMNYGYAGTKELNEALVSRFVVINMPSPDEETLNFKEHVSNLKRICGRAVCRSVSGSSDKSSEQRDFCQSTGSSRASGGDRADEDRTFSDPGNPYGRGQQKL